MDQFYIILIAICDSVLYHKDNVNDASGCHDLGAKTNPVGTVVAFDILYYN